MAKTTATIIGLALAAVSIGVNISRFPIVWEMASPQLASTQDAAPEDKTPPAEEQIPSDPQTVAIDDSSSTEPTKEEPAPQPIAPIASIAPINNPIPQPEAEIDSRPSDYDVAADKLYGPPPSDEEPLVPVNFAGVARFGDETGGHHSVVQRLPPVGQAGQLPSMANSAALMPTYPSTGIE